MEEKGSVNMGNGGPAFPFASDELPWMGMSLRDWFAGMALSGNLVAGPGDAYEIADAMLKRRDK